VPYTGYYTSTRRYTQYYTDLKRKIRVYAKPSCELYLSLCIFPSRQFWYRSMQPHVTMSTTCTFRLSAAARVTTYSANKHLPLALSGLLVCQLLSAFKRQQPHRLHSVLASCSETHQIGRHSVTQHDDSYLKSLLAFNTVCVIQRCSAVVIARPSACSVYSSVQH